MNKNKSIEVQALKDSELQFIQTMAESILDTVSTIRTGRESVKGYLLKVNEDNNISIIKEVNLKVSQGEYEFEPRTTETVR